MKGLERIVISLVISLVVAMPAGAELPAGEYACQVTAEGGRIGLVLVQADSRERAEAAAARARALTYDGVRSPAIEVIQCIDRHGGERFRDFQFQAFYENVPM
jgi:hypothetical protein